MLAKAASATTHVPSILPLRNHMDAAALATACREAGLAFVREADRWSKTELVSWLMGPYADLTQHYAAHARRRSGVIVRRWPGLRALDAYDVERVIRRARAEVSATLASMRDPESGASFAFGMMASGFVVRCEDKDGKLGWTPTNEPGRLTDRVLSLFAANYLTCPADYDRAFSVPPAALISVRALRQATIPWGLRSARAAACADAE